MDEITNMEHGALIPQLANVTLNFVPPINTLPLDILSMIFVDMQPRKRSRHRIPFEVVMSHVCSYWRNTALATPLLWKNIVVYSFKSIGAVSSYLKRSQDCPVSVQIDIWESDRKLDPHDSATSIIPLINLLNEHAMRWKTLLVFAHHRTTTTAILSRMKDLAVPLLERAHIVDDDTQVDSDDVVPFDRTLLLNPWFLLGGAPKLAVFHSNNLEQPPPLANVTTLHLRTTNTFTSFDFNTQVFSSLVTACPSLSVLSIHGRFFGGWTVENVTMSNLRSLWLNKSYTIATKFLTTINLPSLESLWLDCRRSSQVIDVIYDHHPWPSFPSLKYLTLQAFDYYASTKFSQVFSTIEALRLAYCESFRVTFLKQTLVENDMVRWQNLQTLVFQTTRETYSVKFSKVLNDLVMERRVGGRPILRVLLDSDLLTVLTTANSVRKHTSLEELCVDNYADPWWMLTHEEP